MKNIILVLFLTLFLASCKDISIEKSDTKQKSNFPEKVQENKQSNFDFKLGDNKNGIFCKNFSDEGKGYVKIYINEKEVKVFKDKKISKCSIDNKNNTLSFSYGEEYIVYNQKIQALTYKKYNNKKYSPMRMGRVLQITEKEYCKDKNKCKLDFNIKGVDFILSYFDETKEKEIYRQSGPEYGVNNGGDFLNDIVPIGIYDSILFFYTNQEKLNEREYEVSGTLYYSYNLSNGKLLKLEGNHLSNFRKTMNGIYFLSSSFAQNKIFLLKNDSTLKLIFEDEGDTLEFGESNNGERLIITGFDIKENKIHIYGNTNKIIDL